MAATYVGTEQSCVDCDLKEAGACYARTGYGPGFVDRRLNKAVAKAKASRRDVAKAEAAAIDAMPAKGARNRPLRIHVGGDCPNDTTAKITSEAAERWTERTDGPAYGYTHAWKRVRRSSWGKVSILASMEDTKFGKRALARGYAPSVVVKEFPSDKAFESNGVTWVPCPAQTRDDVTCIDCRLCMNADRLVETGMGIAFAAHGKDGTVARMRALCAQ